MRTRELFTLYHMSKSGGEFRGVAIFFNMSCFLTENESSRINYLETQLGLARREISNLRQKLKSLNFMHQKECNRIIELLENWRCVGCRNVEGTAGAVGLPAGIFPMKEIGLIDTHFPEKRGTPRQPTVCSEAVGRLTLNNEVFTNPEHALQGLQEFSHMWILFYFHKNDCNSVKAKVSPPRLNGVRIGVFATRSPHRPSPIGLSLVKINKIAENTIYFSGVDMVDKTPVLDIKPYIPHYDNPIMVNLLEFRGNSESRELENLASPNSPFDAPFDDLSLNVRTMDGEESVKGRHTGAIPKPSSSNKSSDKVLHSRLTSRIGEREAPDGEEEESPQVQSVNESNATSESQVRVPSWIQQSPVNTLHVVFKDKALFQLSQLGAEGEDKKNIIMNVLKEDPRSVYLRERWGSHCYVFRISELYVSCKFNDADRLVTVYKVFQNAEDND